MAVTGRYLFTQPETLLAVVMVVLIYFATHLNAESFNDVLLRFVHLTSFSLYTGISFWVTFVAGLTMFHLLPRNLFSQVQSALFSKFVICCMIFSTTSLITYYLQVKSEPIGRVLNKAGGLIVCVIASFLSCLVFPSLTETIAKRNQMEHAENIGYGIGNDNESCKKLKAASSSYAALYNRVVWLHGASALLNLVSLVGMAIHMATLSYHVTFN